VSTFYVLIKKNNLPTHDYYVTRIITFQQLIRKDMEVSEHERLPNITFIHKLK